MAVTATPPVAPAAATQPAASATASAGSGEDRFLKLLVAQMKNQDPLNPLDNAQVTSQLAQISTVDGISQLNATLKSLGASFAQTQSLQAAALIGHSVLVEGAALNLAGGNAVGGFSLDSAADQVMLAVKDAAGNVIHTAQLGPQAAGVHAFSWDGARDDGKAAADGQYVVSISAIQGGAAVKSQTLTAGSVLGVVQDAAGATSLQVSGVGLTPYSAVKQIF